MNALALAFTLGAPIAFMFQRSPHTTDTLAAFVGYAIAFGIAAYLALAILHGAFIGLRAAIKAAR